MEQMKTSALTLEMLRRQQTGIPIIISLASQRTKRLLRDAGYVKLSLNRELSEALLAYPKEERNGRVISEFKRIIVSKSSPLFLMDYEMLFDPNYKIDVLKMFCEAARLTNIVVLWCGKGAENKLIYAEPSYPDYCEYVSWGKGRLTSPSFLCDVAH